jgi:hypothetical protein
MASREVTARQFLFAVQLNAAKQQSALPRGYRNPLCTNLENNPRYRRTWPDDSSHRMR